MYCNTHRLLHEDIKLLNQLTLFRNPLFNLLEIPPLRTFGSAPAFYFIKTCTSSFITVAGEIRNKYRPVIDFVKVVSVCLRRWHCLQTDSLFLIISVVTIFLKYMFYRCALKEFLSSHINVYCLSAEISDNNVTVESSCVGPLYCFLDNNNRRHI